MIIARKRYDDFVCSGSQAVKTQLSRRGCNNRPAIHLIMQVSLSGFWLLVGLRWIDDFNASGLHLNGCGCAIIFSLRKFICFIFFPNLWFVELFRVFKMR